MKLYNKLYGCVIIQETAKRFKKTPKQVRRGIETCLDEAWNADDPIVREYQLLHFPKGKPSPEEFIMVISGVIKNSS